MYSLLLIIYFKQIIIKEIKTNQGYQGVDLAIKAPNSNRKLASLMPTLSISRCLLRPWERHFLMFLP